jgi:carboxypeptidase T
MEGDKRMDRVQVRLSGLFLAVALLISVSCGKAFALPTQSYDEVKKFMNELVKAHPDTTSLFTLTTGDTGDAIYGLKIGNGAVHNLVVATHHGNEYGSTEVAKGFAQSIAENPVKGQTIFVIPVLNISGYNSNTREEQALASDSQWYDANRDYPGPCGTSGPWHLKSTKALAGFIDQQNIIVSATLHTFMSVVVYPWGISTQDTSTPYDATFKQIADAAAADSKYTVGNSTQLIYAADGCYEDYAFWKHGIWSLLFELGTTHTPDDGQVNDMVKTNVPGLRRMMEQAPTVRAVDHDFHGKCDTRFTFDRHEE